MTKIKSMYLALFVALFAPMSANALLIEITDSGVDEADGVWFVETVTGTGAEFLAMLESQVWFGDGDLALLFANAVGDALGLPNSNGNRGPHFLAVADGSLFAISDPSRYPLQGFRARIGTGNLSRFAVNQWGTWTWAVATSVPEPGTLALLGIGLAGMGMSRRKRKI